MGPEERLHRDVAHYLQLALPAPPAGPFWFHPHNEGRLSKAQAGTAKALGRRKGNPDLWFVWAGAGARPFAIELKAPKGSVRPEQREAHKEIRGAGGEVYVCKSLEAVSEALQAEAVPIRAPITA